MSDYHQPEFYRFSEDSLKLVHFVKANVDSVQNILDVCAGCGVIGMELAAFYQSQLTLVEAQKDFLPSLEQNAAQFLRMKPGIFIGQLSAFTSKEKFDLIVCNPPYYLPAHGQKSTDARRDTARRFTQDGWGELLKLIQISLSDAGQAFLVIKNQNAVLEEIKRNLPSELRKDLFKKDDLIFLKLVRLNIN